MSDVTRTKDRRCPYCGGLSALHPVEGQCVDRPKENVVSVCPHGYGNNLLCPTCDLGASPHLKAEDYKSSNERLIPISLRSKLLLWLEMAKTERLDETPVDWVAVFQRALDQLSR